MKMMPSSRFAHHSCIGGRGRDVPIICAKNLTLLDCDSWTVLSAKLTWRRSHFPSKRHAEIFDVWKAGSFCDLFQRQVRLGEQLFHPVEPHSKNLLVWRPANQLFEAAFQKRA